MDRLREQILEKGNLSEKELEAKVKEKVEKFSGMLNTEAALFLVAREQKINFGEENTLISELKKGKTVNLEAEVVSVYPAREFEKNGKTGKLRNVQIKDKSGTAFLVLWNKETEEISEKDTGKKIVLEEFSVEEFNGKIQLKKGFNGNFELKEGKGIEIKKISEVQESDRNFSVKARVLRKFPLKEFETKEGKKGLLQRIELIDESGVVRVVLWNEKAKEKVEEGKGIELQMVNARKGFDKIELHSNSNTEINEIAGIAELKELCEKVFGKKELNQVVEGKRFLVKGKINHLNKTKLLFNVCSECGKKIQEEENKFFCDSCGQILKPDKKLVVSFELEDESGRMNTIVYGKKGEEILGKRSEEIEERLEEVIVEELIEELNEKIKGKEVCFIASGKDNSFSGETELVLEKLF